MSKFTPEEKLSAVLRHLDEGISIISIAGSIGADDSTVREWCRNYEVFGAQAFSRQGNAHYSKHFKETCVRYYLDGTGSLNDVCKLFKIPSAYTLRDWISLYNSHKLNASPGGGKSMTKGRKTTLEERATIVEACIKGEMNYSKTAELFNVSYQQVYQWVRKYQENGIDGLVDRRGKAKPVSEMTEVERLRAENKRLKAQLERKELENMFLKKLEEIERRQS